MSDFTIVHRNKTPKSAPIRRAYAPRQTGKKQCFQFLKMKDEGAKIGTVIKSLYEIRQRAKGAFINYKRSDQANPGKFDEWMAGQHGLKTVNSQGAGWYIWAFNQESVDQARKLLQRVEKNYLQKQRQYIMRSRNTQEEPEQKPPTADDFPAILGSTSTASPVGAWAKGKPVAKVTAESPVPKTPEQQRVVSRMPPPVLYKKKSISFLTTPESWDHDFDDDSYIDEDLEDDFYDY